MSGVDALAILQEFQRTPLGRQLTMPLPQASSEPCAEDTLLQVANPVVQSFARSMFDVLMPKAVTNNCWRSAGFGDTLPRLCLGALAQGPWCSFSLIS